MSRGSFPALILILIPEMALAVERASAKKSENGVLVPSPCRPLMTIIGEMLALSVGGVQIGLWMDRRWASVGSKEVLCCLSQSHVLFFKLIFGEREKLM